MSLLVQTLKFGTSIADTLRVYAEEFRDKRMQTAEEQAAKIGTKLIFPLVFCLFPSFFVVAIGPAVIRIIDVLESAWNQRQSVGTAKQRIIVMHIHKAHVPASLLGLGLISLGGCASTAAVTQPVAKAPTELYSGQPATVHATEFPVASAADGIQRGDAAWKQGDLDLAIYLYLQAPPI